MEEFMPHRAPLVVLSFLGTVALLGLAGVALVWALAERKYALAKKIFGAGTLLGLLYTGTLLGFSMASEGRTLAPGQYKYFCEVDCHAAYTVAGVQTEKTLGEGEAQVTASGIFYVVRLRTWFDQDTVSRRRPMDLPLWPNPRVAYAVDEAGNRYSTSLAGQKAIVASNVPLSHPLKPGESYETVLVFDLPEGATNPKLWLADRDPVTHLLIGHENSFLHQKILFRLEPGEKNAALSQR